MKPLLILLQAPLAFALVWFSGFNPQQGQEPEPKDAVAKPQEEVQAAPSGLHLDSVRRVELRALMPSFLLECPDGQGINSKDLLGRNYILVYLSAEQRNSERAAADAVRVLRKYNDADLELFLVTADVDHLDYFRAYFHEAQISLPIYHDTGHSLYSKLGLLAFPTTLLVDAQGKLQHVLLTRRSDYPHFLDTFTAHTLGRITDQEMTQRLVAPTMSRSSTKSQAQRHREAARLLRESEWYREAEQELQTARQLDPENYSIHIDLAELYLHLKRYVDADKVLQSVLAKAQDHRGALMLSGIIFFETGQPSKAETLLENALIMNPDPERTHYYLGRIHEDRGDHLGAIEHYRRALDRIMVQ